MYDPLYPSGKVDSTIEPQYETCAEVKIAEPDYTAYNVTGEQIT